MENERRMDWNPERARVEAETTHAERWSLWGPYLSERQWGTVREDYSRDGDAWSYVPFEAARSRAYRWGEDGMFGISDDRQRLCFAVALWNGSDEIVKERLFGLGGHQGNHGEDVKECYYFLDNVPSHAYMKALYKYPQRAFPYRRLIEENARRTRDEPEFELADTGVFDDDAYFDVVIEYAKRCVDDVLIRITATNRGPAAATLHVLPQLWFRNEWSWAPGGLRGRIECDTPSAGIYCATHPELGRYRFEAEPGATPLFTENETNNEALFGVPSPQPYVKDAIDRTIVRGERGATNPALAGSKLALHHVTTIEPGTSRTFRLRLANDRAGAAGYDSGFDGTFDERIREADRFYAALDPYPSSDERHAIERAAIAGLLWSKQYYFYVVRDWLAGDPLQPPPPPERKAGRNREWKHLYNDTVLSMPDTWEYPWYASWDLAFHTIVLALVDPHFAKKQLVTLTREWYMHPSGAIPAYEWAFGDANPPVLAWAAYRVFQIEHKMYGIADYAFLERVFHKLLMNFTWWVNREDPTGANVFAGGFMGLDNIGILNRSDVVPNGGRIVEADSTSWMAVYALDMLAIALELAQHDDAYEDIASKFFEHFLYIATAMNGGTEGEGLWDDADGFYYDRLEYDDGRRLPMRVRSLVGLVPLFAVETLQPHLLARVPNFKRRLDWFVEHRPELCKNVASLDAGGMDARRLLAVLDRERLARVLRVLLDEAEFLSDYGIRSLSKRYESEPASATIGDTTFRIGYEPAESRSTLFGGNSNWRGPVWMPVNYLVIEALQNFHFFYGDQYRVEFPTGSGRLITLWDVAAHLSERLLALFMRTDGRRPFNGATAKFQHDPHFRDLFLFHEYFHGETGAGLGASHQTGWTALVAKLIRQAGEYGASGKSPLAWAYDAAPPPAVAR